MNSNFPQCCNQFEITDDALLELLKPFVQCIAHNQTDARLRDKIDEAVFGYLVEQSDIGIEQQEKIGAWKSV
jgi:hypothetical protein